MGRCKHCNKLTHSEDLVVYFNPEDFEKVWELQTLSNWKANWHYIPKNPAEVGYLTAGDIKIHFVCNKGKRNG